MGFLSSIVVTSSKLGETPHSHFVRTFQPWGEWFGTGPYNAGWSRPMDHHPIAVSTDRDRCRVWIVLANNTVFYGE
jgi:hypothetical protein